MGRIFQISSNHKSISRIFPQIHSFFSMKNGFTKNCYLAYLDEMHFRNLWSERIGLLHPSGNFIPQDKLQPSGRMISSLGASPLGMKSFSLQVLQFIPWDEIQPSGCKTQFFLSTGYEIPHFVKLLI